VDNNHNPVNEVNIRIRVRYAECDAQQIVFNARYGEYADVGATEYMRALIGKHQNMVDAGFDSQVVSLHIDWFASAVFDDELNLRVFVKRIGNTSFTLQTDCVCCGRHSIVSKGANTTATKR
jgi:acyl-CoA thioester hydrolase